MNRLDIYNLGEEVKAEIQELIDIDTNECKSVFGKITPDFKVYINLVTDLLAIKRKEEKPTEEMIEQLLESVNNYSNFIDTKKPYWQTLYKRCKNEDELKIPHNQNILARNMHLLKFDDGFFWHLRNNEEHYMALEFYPTITIGMFYALCSIDYEREDSTAILNNKYSAGTNSMYLEQYINDKERFDIFTNFLSFNIDELNFDCMRIYKALVLEKMEQLNISVEELPIDLQPFKLSKEERIESIMNVLIEDCDLNEFELDILEHTLEQLSEEALDYCDFELLTENSDFQQFIFHLENEDNPLLILNTIINSAIELVQSQQQYDKYQVMDTLFSEDGLCNQSPAIPNLFIEKPELSDLTSINFLLEKLGEHVETSSVLIKHINTYLDYLNMGEILPNAFYVYARDLEINFNSNTEREFEQLINAILDKKLCTEKDLVIYQSEHVNIDCLKPIFEKRRLSCELGAF